MRRLAAVLCLSLLPLAACGGGGGEPAVKVSGAFGSRPDVSIPKGAPDGKFTQRTLVSGKGATVHDGDLVIADYAGYTWNASTSKLIATSYAGDIPAAFPSWTLVPGLKKALVGKKVGSRVVAVIPPGDGYGDKGSPQLQIGGQDSLVYVLDVRAALPKTVSASGKAEPLDDPALPKVGAAAAGQAPPVSIPKAAAPKALTVRTLIQGTGPAVKSGQLLAVQYTGYLWRTGRPFDSSYTAGHVYSTVIGAKQVVQGWDQALVGQKVGSRLLLVVPPKAGYGSKGLAQYGIKGDDTLVYVVDLVAAY
jgi:FKBP-type peptidyl-prolyl cis-trans isomerase